MDDVLTPEEERSALAAELALGLLEGDEHAAALRLQLSDGAFAAEVAAWEARLAPLHGQWADVAPRDSVWAAVAARIGAEDAPPGDVAMLRARVSRWRMGAIVSGALAAGLATLLLMQPAGQMPETGVAGATPVAFVQIAGAAGGPQLSMRHDSGSAQLTLRVSGMKADGLSPELWVIPAGGAPVSLGEIPASGTAALRLSDAQRRLLVEGATLAVTMEPQAGMPHAAPSRAPVAAGQITQI
ncbi:anti-sigma factor [Sphingobium sp. HWE2-09]|uniref:anti-sigma factor n=1 Tax=Sphingobium sp. HWE2-09 TaxID=3108390 RepID=UPI002DD3A76E|nr:anti-sigma factor [Sphingobium sp. HWE2-09]